MATRARDTRPHRPAASPLRLLAGKLWRELTEPFHHWRALRRLRPPKRRPGAGVRWRGRRKVAAARFISYGAALLLLLWVARAAFVVLVKHDPVVYPFGFNPDDTCRRVGASCGALTGFVVSWLSVAAASAVFLLRRLRAVVNTYRDAARDTPEDLVATASGGIVGEVVGRDDLCRVIIDDLRDREDRRPHILIGGVGAGKTAVLVSLTHELAAAGATPVPIRLRDADGELDFQELARTKFLAEVDGRLLSSGEGDRVWRYLLKTDRVVVLADGLEEALTRQDRERDRDNIIRLAVRRAREQGLPVVIASRPHDPLRGADAAILELEPLSRMAALDYLGHDDRTDDRQRLNWIVETADVAEAPLFLRITRELHERDLLRHLTHGLRARGVNTRRLDRSALRLNLFDTWLSALIEGQLRGDVPLAEEERLATVACVAAMAVEGLKADSLQVRYDAVVTKEAATSGPTVGEQAALGHEQNIDRERYVIRSLGRRVRASTGQMDRRPLRIRLAATWGARLGLIEAGPETVRFHHSLLQSYLGSLLLDSVIRDDEFIGPALERADGPGRELLIALVFLSRRKQEVEAGSAGITSPNPLPGSPPADPARMAEIVRRLRTIAADRRDDKSLDMFAAALEIDSVSPQSEHELVATDIKNTWRTAVAPDLRTLDEAKLGLVHRFGDALRQVQRVADIRPAGEPGPQAAYPVLFEIGCIEDQSYAVRHAVAQELGSGGHGAFRALHEELSTGLSPEGLVFDRGNESEWRSMTMRAWLAPLLLGSVDSDELRAQAQDDLNIWIHQVGHPSIRTSREPLPVSIELSLAQGFTYAANRKRRHPYVHSEGRTFLVEQAMELLQRSSFWAAQLTLVHALCLWALPDDQAVGPSAAAPRLRLRPSDPRDRVDRWLASAGSRRDGLEEEGGIPAHRRHPFVAEAANLARRALETQQPERFLWIDVFGVASQIGSRTTGQGGIRRHNLWIPPSVGWSSLDPRAQQLVADVLLLQNLAERGDHAAQRERQLKRANRREIPPCLSGSRRPLDPTREIGTTQTTEPGANCVAGCPFDLCPYPPKGIQSHRTELSDAFCRRQQNLLRRTKLGGRKKAAAWQGALPSELRRFWRDMAGRARR